MSLNNCISFALIRSTDNRYKRNSEWVSCYRNSVGCWLNRNVVCRAGYATAAVLTPITSGLDVLGGLGVGCLSVLTLGRVTSLNAAAAKMTGQGGAFFAYTYYAALKTLNPGSDIGIATTGLFGSLSPIKSGAEWLSEKENFVVKHILSRAFYVVTIFTPLIARTVDLAIGILAGLGSVLCLGNCDTLNDLAYAGFKAGLVVQDIYYGVVKTINPWAEFTEPLNRQRLKN